jgi:hypothetical protein
MAQIFHRSANTLARVTIFGAVFAVAFVLWVIGGVVRSPYATDQGIEREQPVPFSHQHHAGGLGIDCRYCHSSVAEGPHAGLPPTHTCMTCHSQIWTNAAMLAPVRNSLADNTSLRWHRVARLPQYVYFRHDIHIAKGVGCETCHGRVDRMPLMVQAVPFTMDFCLDCHRDPAPRLRPRERITEMGFSTGDRAAGQDLLKQYGIRLGEITYCYVCHR